ncbi:DISARM system helicase DrmA [Deinococcus sp. S9]|uniref:DISARM system helicase DrmA n=1 Tax=Deinococcus sp. S9 TaxID=2545754 RepID=UPI0014044014|nr:DISARM system helicase DrmA [Deinococcus sp. S9]
MRTELVMEVIRDVLGPRGGSRETILENPASEYLVGVLQPAMSGTQQAGMDHLEADAASLPAEDNAEDGGPEQTAETDGDFLDEEEDLDEEEAAVHFSPALDPRNKPASAGLSFHLSATTGEPTIRLCVTWGRYLPPDGEKHPWQRQGRRWISPPLPIKTNTIYLDHHGQKIASETGAELSIHIRCSAVGSQAGQHRVFIQLVNRISPGNAERLSPPDYIFQPSIRVVTGENTRLEPMLLQSHDDEERRLQYLYRERPAFARGHLTSATWRDIDPERPWKDQPGDRPKTLTWADVDLLSPEEQDIFLAPDVRTEFVPMYATQAPSWDWTTDDLPELSPERLSEFWAARQLTEALAPIATGFAEWIDTKKKAIAALPAEEASIAEQLIDEAERLLRRIERGLKTLEENDDARLAFCFANRAIWQQARWASPDREMRWRPFQIAFFLSVLESLVNPDSQDRTVCDLLWVPTGGGKTEAYLAVTAFMLAYRRRRALTGKSTENTGAGTSVITRYTLRLLTLQQFRRALLLITACEYLRISGLAAGRPGWRPTGFNTGAFPWGTVRFSIGLWVGGELTPNRLQGGQDFKGALDILKGKYGKGEPAQILQCPACTARLAVPQSGLPAGSHHLFLTMCGTPAQLESSGIAKGSVLAEGDVELLVMNITQAPSKAHSVVQVQLTLKREMRGNHLNRWWSSAAWKTTRLASMSFANPGYFPRTRRSQNQGKDIEIDFEIWCPNPDCVLGSEEWCETTPLSDLAAQKSGLSRTYQPGPGGSIKVGRHDLAPPAGQHFRRVISPWHPPGRQQIAARIPIPALTVDDQIYAHPPSLLVATVDKLARLSFEPRAAHLFGNVTEYHPWLGFLRTGELHNAQNKYPFPNYGCCKLSRLDVPDLILQDELHLLEGPLGSMVGLYEMAVDHLCRNRENPEQRVKYIASSATVREADSQVAAIFDRRLEVFPPRGSSADERFFLSTTEPHPLDESRPGQLFVGLAAPGAGPLKPIYRLWSILLQATHERRSDADHDYFATLAGYFNAVRELAGARALTRQDIPAHLKVLAEQRGKPRHFLSEDQIVELSGRLKSTDLPAILDRLSDRSGAAPNALLATSMFGTGVDVTRMSLMLVHGQPKTTSSYIQAAGRVGRERAALVLTFFRASRPRDLSHYEFFTGYHRQLYRHVEPITVMPFSPGAMEIASGPALVALLRNMFDDGWRKNARYIVDPASKTEQKEVMEIARERSQAQPEMRRPDAVDTVDIVRSGLDKWVLMAHQNPRLHYQDYLEVPSDPVVLGGAAHRAQGLDMVYPNAPQSLREVEETIAVEVREAFRGLPKT